MQPGQLPCKKAENIKASEKTQGLLRRQVTWIVALKRKGTLQNFMKKPAQIATITKTGMGCRDTKFSKICREEEHLIVVRKLRKQLNGLQKTIQLDVNNEYVKVVDVACKTGGCSRKLDKASVFKEEIFFANQGGEP